MSTLRYKTRGDVAPTGKRRVYFCCHDEDFGDYFEDITREILQTVDCEIWYRDPGNEETADLDMNLFVLPVTPNLLTPPNRALEEFRYAQEHNIPVLPLMQKQGLETLFNELCGDLQLLDAKAAAYPKKLESFLNSVLISDEIAEMIRQEFDARLFMSYRKMDRQHVRDLISRIHGISQFRDVATWYDEYLVPGENFNRSILEELEKSHLFVLTVTPNIVKTVTDEDGTEKDNYVVRAEYPAAQGKKPVLPISMVTTDGQLLADKFPGISPCVDGNDTAALKEALLEKLEGIDLRGKSGPKHDYLMGLAYLSGVDVEVDGDRAKELIETAANEGLEDAILRLVDMYRTGNGVERNYHVAVDWQKRLVENWEAAYRDKQELTVLDQLFWCIRECGDQYRGIHLPEEAKKMYEKGLRYLEECPWQSHELVQHMLDVSGADLGIVEFEIGNSQKARAYYERSLKGTLARKDLAKDPILQLGLVNMYGNLGDICRAEEDWTAAEDYYQQALEIAQSVAKVGGNVEFAVAPARVLMLLGDNRFDQKQYDEAQKYYDRALELVNKVSADYNEELIRITRIIIHNRLGLNQRRSGNIDQAAEYYQKALELAKEHYRLSGTVDAGLHLSVAYQNMGNTYRRMGEPARAVDYFRRGLEVSTKLSKDARGVKVLEDIANCQTNMAGALRDAGEKDESRQCMLDAIAAREKLDQLKNTKDSKLELIGTYLMLVEYCQKDGDNKGLLEAQRGVAKYYDQLAEALGLKEYDELHCKYCHGYADGYWAQEKWRLAAEFYEYALRSARRMAEYEENGANNLALVLSNLADAHQRLGRSKDAVNCLREGVKIMEDLVKKGGSDVRKETLTRMYARLGLAYDASGGQEQARKYYRKGHQLAQRLCTEEPSPRRRDQYAFLCYELARLEDRNTRRKLLEKALEIWAKLAEENPLNMELARNRDKARNALKKI